MLRLSITISRRKFQKGESLYHTRDSNPLVFQKTLGENYTQADLGTIRPTVNGPLVFHKEVKKTDPKLTTVMRSMINNPYVLPQSDSEADP